MLQDTLHENAPFHQQLATLIKEKPYLGKYKESLETFKQDYDINNIEFF
jgi:hypothetical protein